MLLIKASKILKEVFLIQAIFLFTCTYAGNGNSRRTLVSDVNPLLKGEPDGGPSCTNEYLVEYMVLSMSWPPGVCSSGRIDCKKGGRKNFVIKGLNPMFKESKGRCCAKETFDPEELQPLESELKANWPALDDKEEREVWTKEWEQSGKCASKIKGLESAFKYFKFALRNFNKLALKSALKTKGFYPTNQQTYHGQNLVTAIYQRYGVRADLECGSMKLNPKRLVLTEINFCYDTDLKQIDCPYSSNKCLGDVSIVKTYLDTKDATFSN